MPQLRQQPGSARGKCVLPDELDSLLSEIEAADALILAAPVNFYNVNALFRRFMERTLGYVYWPWGQQRGPVPRIKLPNKVAAPVTSAAMPGLLIPLGTGAPRALKITAKILGPSRWQAYGWAFRGSVQAGTLYRDESESEADWASAGSPGPPLPIEQCKCVLYPRQLPSSSSHPLL